MSAVSLEKLTKVFGGVVAVDHVDLEIEEGELFSLLGPNGAGKSTIMRILSTVLLPTEGRALIKGLDVVKDAMKVRRIIGVCPQDTVLYDYLTGEENLRFFGTLHGLSGKELDKRVDEVLNLLQLREARKRRFKGYSGGMKHRLNLGVALLHEPEVLILDEPTTGLDPQGRRAVWDIIEGFRGEKKTVLLSTHYMEEADYLSDRVAIMDRGRIIACDTPENLKESLGGEEVVEVYSLKIPDRIREVVLQIPTVNMVSILHPDKAEEMSVLKVFTEDADAIIPTLVQKLTDSGLRIERLEVSKPTLEDVFIKLTGRSLRE